MDSKELEELRRELKEANEKVAKLVVYSEQVEAKVAALEGGNEVVRALRELYAAFCNRDEGHKDDFSHGAWKRWENAQKNCVALGEKLPEPCPTIEIEREEDGRWLAECSWKSGAMAYGPTLRDAVIAAVVIAEPSTPVWEDKPIPEDDAIRAAHPTKTGEHERYAEAMRLVGAKHSKYALVDLVNWLLMKISAVNDNYDKATTDRRKLRQQVHELGAKPCS